MSDKPIAALVAAAVVVPLCVACALGPAAIGTATAWAAGWFGGLSPMGSTGLALFTGLALYAFFRRWGAKRREPQDGSTP